MASSAVRDCGLIVEGVSTRPERSRIFQDDDESKRRTGGPRTVTRHDRGLSTTIGRKRDARGTRSRQKRRQLARLRREHDRARFRSKRERNLAHGLGGIDRLTAQLGLSKSVQEQASSLFRTAQDANLLIGRSIESIAAGCVYATCRINDVPRTLDGSRVSLPWETRRSETGIWSSTGNWTSPYLRSSHRSTSRDSSRRSNCAVGRNDVREKNRDGSSRRWPRDGRQPAGFAAGCVAVAAAKQGERSHPAGSRR